MKQMSMSLTRSTLFLLFFTFLTTTIRADSNELAIGAITILTGESSNIGRHTRQAAEMAIDEINSSGGINGKKLRFIWEDETDAKAERAVTAYKKLTAVDRVRYIFGPGFQDAMMALAPMGKRDNILFVSPSTPSLGLTDVFSTWIDPVYEANIIAERMAKTYKRVSVLAAQQSWELMVGEAFRKKFEELGGTVASYHDPLLSSKDLRGEAGRVKKAGPEAVLISSYTLFPQYVKALRQQGVDIPIFTVEADYSNVTAAGKAGEGVVSIGPSAPETEFTKSYQKRFGEKADIPARQSYDAVKLLADALTKKGEDIQGVREYFRTLSSYEGVSGKITIVGGRTHTSTTYSVIRNGELVAE